MSKKIKTKVDHNNVVDWNKEVTFNAAKEGFTVGAIKVDVGYKISTAHYGFVVSNDGKPFNDFLGSDFSIKNT